MNDAPPLTVEEQQEIAAMSYLEKELFTDYLLDRYSDGPDYYEGWTRVEYNQAIFSGPEAWREAFKVATKRRFDKK